MGVVTPGGSGPRWALYPRRVWGKGRQPPFRGLRLMGVRTCASSRRPREPLLSCLGMRETQPQEQGRMWGGLAQHSDPGGRSCPGARTVGRPGEPPAGVTWHARRGTKGPLGILMPCSSRGGSARKYNVCWVFFIKAFMGSGNLNAAEPELNWKAKVSKLVHLKGKKIQLSGILAVSIKLDSPFSR